MQIVVLWEVEVAAVVHLIIKMLRKVRTATSAYSYDLVRLSNQIVYKRMLARSNIKILNSNVVRWVILKITQKYFTTTKENIFEE